MSERIFNINTEKLGTNSEKYINDIYDSYIPDGRNSIAALKKPASPWDKRLQRIVHTSDSFKSPYELICKYTVEDISGFYVEILNKINSVFSEYGERAEPLRTYCEKCFVQSAQTTFNNIFEEVIMCAKFNLDKNTVLKRVHEVLQKRRKSLFTHLDSVYLQIVRCVVLWDYEDRGLNKYRITASPETCPLCESKDGEEFFIKDIIPIENFPPFHPNCLCAVALLDENGDILRILDSAGEFIEYENTHDLIDYAKQNIKKLILLSEH